MCNNDSIETSSGLCLGVYGVLVGLGTDFIDSPSLDHITAVSTTLSRYNAQLLERYQRNYCAFVLSATSTTYTVATFSRPVFRRLLQSGVLARVK